jgi:hypothetical protein
MPAAPLPVAERVRVAGFNLMVARASYDIWWLYQGADTRPLYIEGMQAYSEFFRYDQEAHFRAMIVGLCALFDGRRDTVTLKSLLREAKAAGHDVNSLEDKLAVLEVCIAKIKVLRNNLFAHRNHGVGYSDVYKSAKVCPDDVKAVLEGSLTIVNELALLTGAKQTDWNEGVADHTSQLLRDIQPRADNS